MKKETCHWARNILSGYIVEELLPEGSENELYSTGFSPLGYNEWMLRSERTNPPSEKGRGFRTTCLVTDDGKNVVVTVEERKYDYENDYVYELSEKSQELMQILNKPSAVKIAYLFLASHSEVAARPCGPEYKYGIGPMPTDEEVLAKLQALGAPFEECVARIVRDVGLTAEQAVAAIVAHRQAWNE